MPRMLQIMLIVGIVDNALQVPTLIVADLHFPVHKYNSNLYLRFILRDARLLSLTHRYIDNRRSDNQPRFVSISKPLNFFGSSTETSFNQVCHWDVFYLLSSALKCCLS